MTARLPRSLLLWMTALALGAVILLEPRTAGSPLAYPSSYSPQPQGAQAAYDWLAQAGYPVERWLRPPQDLPAQPQNVTLVLAEPFLGVDATAAQRASLRRFVQQGGRVVIAGSEGPELLPLPRLPLALAASKADSGGWRNFQALEPGQLTAGASRIRMQVSRVWNVPRSAPVLPVYGAAPGDGRATPGHQTAAGTPATVVRFDYGRGEVVWWAGAGPLTNQAIAQGGDLQLLLNSIDVAASRRILWDEYYHGQREGGVPEVGTMLRAAGLPLAFLAFALLWSFSRRRGPVQAELPSARRDSPLEFATHLGGLYERAHATGLALGVLAQAAKLRQPHSPVVEAACLAAAEPGLDEAAALALARRLRQAAMPSLAAPPERRPAPGASPLPRMEMHATINHHHGS